MIDGLIAGKLYGTAVAKMGQGGKVFVVAKVRAAVNGDETMFVNVIAFDDDVKDKLLALDDGDSLALTGSLTPKVWTDKQGNTKPALDMVAHVVLTAYQVRHKRQAVQHGTVQHQSSRSSGGFDDMSDDL